MCESSYCYLINYVASLLDDSPSGATKPTHQVALPSTLHEVTASITLTRPTKFAPAPIEPSLQKTREETISHLSFPNVFSNKVLLCSNLEPSALLSKQNSCPLCLPHTSIHPNADDSAPPFLAFSTIPETVGTAIEAIIASITITASN